MSTDNANAQPVIDNGQDLEINKYFRAVVKLLGSHFHLKAGRPPFVRINGILGPLNHPPVEDEEMTRLVLPLLNVQDRRRRLFQEDGGVDFAHTIEIDGQTFYSMTASRSDKPTVRELFEKLAGD